MSDIVDVIMLVLGTLGGAFGWEWSLKAAIILFVLYAMLLTAGWSLRHLFGVLYDCTITLGWRVRNRVADAFWRAWDVIAGRAA